MTIAGKPSLEGVFWGSGTELAVVAPPHPLMGGELGNPVVSAIAEGLVRAGLRALLFNYRGVGESEGEASGDFADAVLDYRAALAVARTSGVVRVFAGYSFGGAAALHLAAGDVDGVVLAVAPPPPLLSRELLGSLRGGAIVSGGRDAIAPDRSIRELASGSTLRVETFVEADHFFFSVLPDLGRVAEKVAGGVR